MRKAGVASGIVGVLLVIAAFLTAFWITPSYIARLPGNYNKTYTYQGTLSRLLDPTALASGNLAGAFKTGLPQTIGMHVKVLRTSGNAAQVKYTNSETISGIPVASVTENYAVDRRSLEATASHPSNWSVTKARGLVVSWPIPAEKHNYTGWVELTGTTVPLKYIKQVQHGGISTYEYQSAVPATPITSSQALAALPKSLPVALAPKLKAAGLISASQASALGKLFPHAASIPLGYTYESTSTYWVDPATGLIVDIKSSERQLGGVKLPGGKIVPFVPVLIGDYQATKSSLNAAVSNARNGASAISTWGITVPVIAGVVGFLLVMLGAILWWRREN